MFVWRERYSFQINIKAEQQITLFGEPVKEGTKLDLHLSQANCFRSLLLRTELIDVLQLCIFKNYNKTISLTGLAHSLYHNI